MMDNMEQVRLFLEANNLKMKYNGLKFQALVTYCDKFKHERELMNVHIDEGFNPKITLLTDNWDSTKIPIEYLYAFGSFKFDKDKNHLEINHKHPDHGKYILIIKTK